MDIIIPLGILLGVVVCVVTIYFDIKDPIRNSSVDDDFLAKKPLFGNGINHTECEYTIGPFARHDPNYSRWIGEDD